MAPTTTGKQPSGKYWVTWANANAKNSERLEDLEPDFRKKAEAFIQALRDAGTTVTISATRRSDKRAYLFHWCWMIGLGKAKPSEARRCPACPSSGTTATGERASKAPKR